MKKTQDIRQLKSKNPKELIKEINEAYIKLQKLKFSQSFGKIKDNYEISKNKKNIARIWTILREKSLKESSEDL